MLKMVPSMTTSKKMVVATAVSKTEELSMEFSIVYVMLYNTSTLLKLFIVISK